MIINSLVTSNVYKIALLLLLTPFACSAAGASKSLDNQDKVQALIKNNMQPIDDREYIIRKIIVQGNKHIKEASILNGIPYKEGDLFDASLSSAAINNLYSLGHFGQVEISAEVLEDKGLALYVMVEEKKLLEDLKICGNKSIKTSKIKEKLNLGKLATIDAETLHHISLGIKKLYAEESRHFVTVETAIVPNEENPDKAVAQITVNEGESSSVLYVLFKGNCHIDDRKLRSFLFTRENWLFSFTDGAGTFSEDQLEMDKHRIEYFYRDNGYLMAKVPKAEVIYSNNQKHIKIVFHVQEGDIFHVKSIQAPGDDLFTEKELLSHVALEVDKPFSQSKLVKSINKLKDLWGDKGYIYADVYPQIKPNEETKEVDVTFHSERGNKLHANRISITGNLVTRDKVIRRQLTIFEGDLITTTKLQESKIGVEYLSFFDREGIAWKLHRVSDNLSDLEMHVVETKTGSANLQFTYGSDRYSPRPSLKGQISIEKTNLCGKGWEIGGSAQASRHRLQRIEAHFFDPHLFDSNVSFGIYGYSRWLEYEQWKSLSKSPVQVTTGGNVKFGFSLPAIDKRLHLILDVGLEDIRNKDIDLGDPRLDVDFAPVVRRIFQEGTMFWIGLDLVKDTRNHQVYPNQGYKITLSSKTAIPGLNNQFGFLATEVQGSCYNALIGVDSLVLATHVKLSHLERLGKHHIIPYKELYHMGGQTTVRGHVWGGIGPAWKNGDPLGAQNAILFNAELIFPLIPDYSMKAHFFYDAGAGWDTPKNDIRNVCNIRRDHFDLRHTAGFGLNLLKPMPAKVDWGFKLDRRKTEGESAHEFHISMNYAW